MSYTSVTNSDCSFCLPNDNLWGNVVYEDDLWWYMEWSQGSIDNAGMIITKRHIETPFEINEEEWLALHKLLPKFKSLIDAHNPDGYNLGWNILPIGGQNVMHAHLHLLPRYADEPLAGKGIRAHIKSESNKRQ